MIIGAHVLLYSRDPEADRAFFRDVLGFRWVDAGGGWPIFALPPAEAAVHPAAGHFGQEEAGQEMIGAVLYLMCDDLRGLMASLEAKGVKCSPPAEERWGTRTTIGLPSGGEIGLYQPSHPTTITSPC